MSPSHLDGRTVAITGGAGGFGLLLGQQAAARGARVALCDLSAEHLDAAVASITETGGEAIGMVADVRDLDQMRGMAAATVEAFGGIDVMVNNAGVMPLALYSDHRVAGDAWERCIDVNFKGVLNGISAVYDQMIEQGRGHVVNVSSIYGNQPVAGAAVYGATKAAVVFLSEALRLESRGRIKVTTVRPTGVPGTALGDGIVNPAALAGVIGGNAQVFEHDIGLLFSENPPAAMVDPDDIGYTALSPELLVDQIIHAIDQPWGVVVSDITVRASADHYVI